MATNTQIALIIGSQKYNTLVEMIFDLGFLTVVRHDLINVMNTLRHVHPALIVIDFENFQGDLLEYILNIRDLHRFIPIFVFGYTSRIIKKIPQIEQKQILFFEHNIVELKRSVMRLKSAQINKTKNKIQGANVNQ